MKRVMLAFLVAVGIGFHLPEAKADLVKLDLLAIGWPTRIGSGGVSNWTHSFDMGVEFAQIDQVYIEWAGQMTVSIGTPFGRTEPQTPLDMSIFAYIQPVLPFRSVVLTGGLATYPEPQGFGTTTAFSRGPWTDLNTGRGVISVEVNSYIFLDNAMWVRDGTVDFSKAVLVIDGTPVPEPATLLLLELGGLVVRRVRK